MSNNNSKISNLVENNTYYTDATKEVRDNDTFDDGIEVSLGVSPLNKWIYPKPDLNLSNTQFSNNILTITVENIGIWSATNMVVYVEILSIPITIYNNSLSPFNLAVSAKNAIIIDISNYNLSLQAGIPYSLNITLDPLNIINETSEGNNVFIWFQLPYTPTSNGIPTGSHILYIKKILGKV